jgi:phosphoglycerol transferase MdoB-like AlkP superfamily enzyme
MKKLSKRPLPLELIFALVLIATFWLPRFYLNHKVHLSWSALNPLSLGNLILFDLVVVGYFLMPWLLLSFLWPKKRTGRKTHLLFFLYLSVAIFLSVLTCISEFFFIDEFFSRYNFIAVDYLVYTSEVLKNIWESYPIVPIILILSSLSLSIGWWLSRSNTRIAKPIKLLAMALFLGLFWFVREDNLLDQLNESQKEFSKNSFHALFAAFRNNEIDFEKFYPILKDDQAVATVHKELRSDFPNDAVPPESAEDSQSLISNIKNQAEPPKRNVVLVLMESMSAKYLKAYGGEGLTPNLDLFREAGLSFDNLYSTGTRTVRGLEAVLLSLPPTPGQSILRRPKSDNLFTLGSVFEEQGYDLNFIYGGHAFFDNMREFFESNHFRVQDQGEFPAEMIHFANAWGVCDEDAFDFALSQANLLAAKQKPFFQLILTTSNHRPYTFPSGRIDRPSGSGRESAVKYSDWSIGHFIAEAQKQPWFDNTVFIFVADHDAAVAGGTKIMPDDYKIPFIIYAPKIVKPEKVLKLGSQIDVGPSLLGLLKFTYQTRFFGHDLRYAQSERAFLGTYQKLAYMNKTQMAVLSPPKKWEKYKLIGSKPELESSGSGVADDDFIKTAIAFYQTASSGFRNRRIGLENKFPTEVNVRKIKIE